MHREERTYGEMEGRAEGVRDSGRKGHRRESEGTEGARGGRREDGMESKRGERMKRERRGRPEEGRAKGEVGRRWEGGRKR